MDTLAAIHLHIDVVLLIVFFVVVVVNWSIVGNLFQVVFLLDLQSVVSL